jgi:hypothetical protein
MNISDPSNWMSDNLALLGPRTLSQISMPASHDSGMYKVSDCTPDISILRHGPYGVNACNTQTQTLSIRDQLDQGSRYFDIRPVMFGDDDVLYTGHYALKSPVTLGCNGPTLADFFQQVSDFMAESGDLVILKFSHYYNRNTSTDRFSDAEMTALIAQVHSILGPNLYTGNVPPQGFLNATLGDLISSGGRALVVFDTLPDDLRDPASGIYSYADAPARGDLTVFDQYADCNVLGDMIIDQKAKLTNVANHTGCLFLLSWTLTQDGEQAIKCGLDVADATTILDLADQANPDLQSTLQDWISNGTITPRTWPNFLYVDDNNQFSLHAAVYLNSQFSTL